jgi:hypothetical protein
MGASVEQVITTRIRAIVDGLQTVNQLNAAIRALKREGGKKFDLGTGPAQSNAIKLVTVIRQLSPALDSAASKGEQLTGALGSGGGLLGVLGPLGAALGVVVGLSAAVGGGLIALAAHAAEDGARFHDLAIETGLSVETISGLELQLKQSGATLEDFSNGVFFMQKNLQAAADENKHLKATFADLGVKDANAALKDTDATLRTVLLHLAQIPDAGKRNAIGAEVMGRAYRQLRVFLEDTGGDIDKVIEKARAAGMVMSKEAADAADEFGDRLDELKLRASRLATTLGSQLIPEFNRLFNVLSTESGKAGSVVNFVFQGILFTIRQSVNEIIILIAAIKTTAELAKIASNGPPGQVAAVLVAKDLFDKNLKELAEAANATTVTPKAGGGGFEGGGGGSQSKGKSLAEKLRELQAQLEKSEGEINAAESEARAADIKDHLAREKQLITQSLEDRLISYKEYYAALARIETESIDQEILRQQAALDKIQSELDAKRKEIAGDKNLTPGERVLKETIAANDASAKATPILQRIAELERDRAGVTARVAAEARKTTEEYQKQLATLQSELLRFQHDNVGAARIEIDQRFKEIRERAEAEGDKTALAIIDALKKRLLKKAQFDDVEQQIRDVFQRLRDAEDFIDAQVSTGQIGPKEAERQKLEAAQRLRAELEALHGELKGIAEATKDPELLEAVNRLGVEIAQVGVQVDHLAQEINGELKSALKDTLFAVIRHQGTLKEIFSDLVNHILDELARLASSAIVDQLFGEKGIFGGLFGGGGGQGGIGGFFSKIFGGGRGGNSSGGINLPFGVVPIFAEGGVVEGPGTETSDSILARLSRREYVVRAAAVRRIGTRALDFINDFGRLPAFAMGGVVDDLASLDLRGAGGVTIQQTFNSRYDVRDGRLTRESRQQIERDAARLTKRGAARSIASNK